MKLLLTSFFMLFIVAFGFVGCNKNVDTGIKNDTFSEQNVVNFEENNEDVELPILTDLPEIIVEKYKIKQAKSIPAVKLSATFDEIKNKNISVLIDGVYYGVSAYFDLLDSLCGKDATTTLLLLGARDAYESECIRGCKLNFSVLKKVFKNMTFLPEEINVVLDEEGNLCFFDNEKMLFLLSSVQPIKELSLFDLTFTVSFDGCNTKEIAELIISRFPYSVVLPEIKVGGKVLAEVKTEGDEGGIRGFTAWFFTEGGKVFLSLKNGVFGCFYYNENGDRSFAFCNEVYLYSEQSESGAGVNNSEGLDRRRFLYELLNMVNVEKLSPCVSELLYPQKGEGNLNCDLYYLNADVKKENRICLNVINGYAELSLFDARGGDKLLGLTYAGNNYEIDDCGILPNIKIPDWILNVKKKNNQQAETLSNKVQIEPINAAKIIACVKIISLKKGGCSVRFDCDKLNELLSDIYKRVCAVDKTEIDLYSDLFLPKLKGALPKILYAPVVKWGLFDSLLDKVKSRSERLNPNIVAAVALL